jgi:hypothetical protein
MRENGNSGWKRAFKEDHCAIVVLSARFPTVEHIELE